VDGVRVVFVADIDPDRKALCANRRRPVELELSRRTRKYSLFSATLASRRAPLA
jgi:hypothetical protein